MLEASRLKMFLVAHDLTSAQLAEMVGVSVTTVDRYRAGVQPSEPVRKLMRQYWPEWWPFLTQQTNTIPNPQPQPETVRVVEKVQS